MQSPRRAKTISADSNITLQDAEASPVLRASAVRSFANTQTVRGVFGGLSERTQEPVLALA